MTDVEDQVGVVLHQQDAGATGADRLDQPGQSFDLVAGKARGRLVEQQEIRIEHQRARNFDEAQFAVLQPDFLLLDEPAAGLSNDEIVRLGALIKAISRRGTGVLLVEHHADLIFDICDQVTVLNLGKILAAGTPAEIRTHKEVVSAYLGG